MSVEIYEVFRAVFYTPLYAAFALGNFEREGLDVSLSTSPTPDQLPDMLLSGEIEIGWGGPMAVMLNHDQNPDSDLVVFCEVVEKDPFFIIGREPLENFKPSDMVGKSFAPMPESPTPWMLLKNDLIQAGVPIEDLHLIETKSMQDSVDRFRRGELDAIQVYEPHVSQLLSEGNGHIWYSGAERGRVGFTAFYTTRRTAEKSPDLLLSLTRAIHKTQQWVATTPAAKVAETVQAYLPDVPLPILAESIKRYQELKVWAQNPVLSKESYERLRKACISGGLFTRETPYAEACIPNIAQKVIDETSRKPAEPKLQR